MEITPLLVEIKKKHTIKTEPVIALLHSQVLDFIPTFKGKRYNWQECVAEIRFLHTYTYLKMKRDASKVEPQKLAYIYHALTEPSDVDMECSLELRKNFTYSK